MIALKELKRELALERIRYKVIREHPKHPEETARSLEFQTMLSELIKFIEKHYVQPRTNRRTK